MIDIADEREREVVLRRELLAVFATIEADADDLGVLRLELFVEVPEPGTFRGSAGCVGLRKEPEDDFLSAIVFQTDRPVVMIDSVEVGSSIARFEHARTSCERLPCKTKSAGE